MKLNAITTLIIAALIVQIAGAFDVTADEFDGVTGADGQDKLVAHGTGAAEFDAVIEPRARVIIDNDFGGDPDGLFALAQHLLSPSVEIRGVIGSINYPGGFDGYPDTPEYSCSVVTNLLAVMALAGKVSVYTGANERIGKSGVPIESAGARFIVREAMRTDTKTPLYVACGAGLTDLASAYLMEPKIAEHIRLVWIGGREHEGIASPPPGGQRVEYNLGLDLKAGQIIFDESKIPIWQVPRDAYRQCLVSYAELHHRMKTGKLADFLLGRLNDIIKRANGTLGETYVLGDSPLVLLTTLQSAWESDSSSSRYINMPTPKINDLGLYKDNPKGRPIRVYTQIDTRLMFEDLYGKVVQFDQRGETEDLGNK